MSFQAQCRVKFGYFKSDDIQTPGLNLWLNIQVKKWNCGGNGLYIGKKGKRGRKKEFMCEKKRVTEKERDRERKIKLWREGSHRKQGEGKNCCVRESEKRQRERAKS